MLYRRAKRIDSWLIGTEYNSNLQDVISNKADSMEVYARSIVIHSREGAKIAVEASRDPQGELTFKISGDVDASKLPGKVREHAQLLAAVRLLEQEEGETLAEHAKPLHPEHPDSVFVPAVKQGGWHFGTRYYLEDGKIISRAAEAHSGKGSVIEMVLDIPPVGPAVAIPHFPQKILKGVPPVDVLRKLEGIARMHMHDDAFASKNMLSTAPMSSATNALYRSEYPNDFETTLTEAEVIAFEGASETDLDREVLKLLIEDTRAHISREGYFGRTRNVNEHLDRLNELRSHQERLEREGGQDGPQR